MSGLWRSEQSVLVKDQGTGLFDQFLSQKINDVTLAVPCLIGDETCTLVAGHGVLVGEYLEFWEGGFWFQTEVEAVNVNVISMGLPMDIPKTVNANVRRTNVDLAVDGSVTPVIFSFSPVGIIQYDIVRAIIVMIHDSGGDDSKFGNLPALTNGFYGQIYIGADNIQKSLWKVKTNGGLRIRAYDLIYSDKAGPGLFGTSWRRTFGGQNKNGVVIRVNPHRDMEFQIIVRDDLTDLIQFSFVVQGHEVEF